MPMMGSRGGGSVRGFGRFGKALLLSFIDSLNRTTSGTLGTSSDGKAIWSNIRGTWIGNGSSAINADAASNNSITTVTLDGSTITNAQVDVNASGGVGLAFWVEDSNNYYSIFPSYDLTTSSSTTCSLASTNSGYNNYSGFCANGSSYLLEYRECQVAFGVFYYCANVSGGNCCSANGYSTFGGYPYSSEWFTSGTRNQTIITSTYTSKVNLKKVQSGSETNLISSNYNSSNSAYSKASSIAISTSNDTISYSFYSGTGKSGSLLASGSNTPSTPIKGNKIGIFKGTSTTEQGSTLNNIEVTVTA
jgi:hypothetical protein